MGFNSKNKTTGSGSGTARDTQIGTAPQNLAKKDVLKDPKIKVSGTGSGTAGDALLKAVPPFKNLAKDNPLLPKAKRPKADSAERVLNAGENPKDNNLAKHAQQLPPKDEDEPLSFCTHKEKGRNDPQARSERQPSLPT